MGDEGAHLEFVRQGEGAAVRVVCALDVHGLSADGDVAKQPVHVGEMPALLVSVGQRERLRCQSHGAVDAILHELGFGQPSDPESPGREQVHRDGLRHGLVQEG